MRNSVLSLLTLQWKHSHITADNALELESNSEKLQGNTQINGIPFKETAPLFSSEKSVSKKHYVPLTENRQTWPGFLKLIFHKYLFIRCNKIYYGTKWSCLLFPRNSFLDNTHRRQWTDRTSQGLDVIMPNKSSIPAVWEEVGERNQKFFLLCGALSATGLFHGWKIGWKLSLSQVGTPGSFFTCCQYVTKVVIFSYSVNI